MSRNRIAELLLSVGAVELRTEEPFFTFASGIRSPVYTDNRLLLALPEARRAVCEAFIERLRALEIQADVIAGTATAGIPHAASLADALSLPLVYVRGQAKGHGKQRRIEGRLAPGANVVLVEDLISTGGSVLAAAEALHEAGCRVVQVLAIFSYGFPVARDAFGQAALSLTTLVELDELLAAARSAGRLNDHDESLIRRFRADPQGWLGGGSAVTPGVTPG